MLVCWAERDPAGARASRRAGAPHPFAVEADELAGLFPASPPVRGTRTVFATRQVLLPTVAGRPVPSPEAATAELLPAPRSTPRPGTWTVPTVELTPAQALDVLTAAFPDERDGSGVI